MYLVALRELWTLAKQYCFVPAEQRKPLILLDGIQRVLENVRNQIIYQRNGGQIVGDLKHNLAQTIELLVEGRKDQVLTRHASRSEVEALLRHLLSTGVIAGSRDCARCLYTEDGLFRGNDTAVVERQSLEV